MEKSYNIERAFARILNQPNNNCIAITRTSFYGGPARLDIRRWRNDTDGNCVPYEGFSLTIDEAKRLIKALKDTVEQIDNEKGA